MISFRKFYESIIDFPKKKVCEDLWEYTDDNTYYLKDEMKSKIIETLELYPTLKLNDIVTGIRIVGSITTNLYSEDSDIDVHITIPTKDLPKEKTFEDWQKDIVKFYNDNPVKVNQHPIQIYPQDNFFQDLLSDGVYDVINNEWLVEPNNKNQSYNPYEFFKDIFTEVQKYAKKIDLDIGELKRDIKDYEIIKDALSKLDNENKKKLKKYLENKYDEINSDIENLLKDKLMMKNMRKHTSQPKNEKDIQKLKKDKIWLRTNAIFKFIAKYGYLQFITDIEKMLDEDGEIPPEKIQQIK